MKEMRVCFEISIFQLRKWFNITIAGLFNEWQFFPCAGKKDRVMSNSVTDQI